MKNFLNIEDGALIFDDPILEKFLSLSGAIFSLIVLFHPIMKFVDANSLHTSLVH